MPFILLIYLEPKSHIGESALEPAGKNQLEWVYTNDPLGRKGPGRTNLLVEGRQLVIPY